LDQEFWKTAMGRQYFDRSLPTLIQQLGELNTNLATFNEMFKQGIEIEKKREAEKQTESSNSW
tara:strand:+ start:793 stop:981 length:189 start_codon:yes stop_codon:yes gene_type:complete